MAEECGPPTEHSATLSKPVIIGVSAGGGLLLLACLWFFKRCCFKNVDHDYSAAFEHWNPAKSHAASRNSDLSMGKMADSKPPLPLQPAPMGLYPDPVPLAMPEAQNYMVNPFDTPQTNSRSMQTPQESMHATPIPYAPYPTTSNTTNSPFTTTNTFTNTSGNQTRPSQKHPEAASWFSGRSARDRSSLQSTGSKQSGSTGYGSVRSGTVSSRHPHRRQESAEFLLSGQSRSNGKPSLKSGLSTGTFPSRNQTSAAPILTLTRASQSTVASNNKGPATVTGSTNPNTTTYGSSWKPGSSWQGSQPTSSAFGGKKIPLNSSAPSLASTKQKTAFDQATQAYGSSFQGAERQYQSSSVPFGQNGPMAAATTTYTASERTFAGGGSSYKGTERFAPSSIPFNPTASRNPSGPSTYAGSSYKAGSEKAYPQSTVRLGSAAGGATTVWGASTIASRMHNNR